MANRGRFRRKAGSVIKYPVASATVIESGDMLYYDQSDNTVHPASGFTYVTSNLAQTQANFARDFVGLAEDKSDNGDTDDIAVGCGQYEMDCASASFALGDIISVDDNAGGTALLDQQVIAMGEQGVAGGIGVVKKEYGTAVTSVVVEFMPYAHQIFPVQVVTLYSGLVTSAADLLTTYRFPWPCKLLELRGIHTVALTTADSVITVENGTTDLDDTLTLTQSTSAVGLVETATMNDATGDDIYGADDTISLECDGGAAAGEAIIQAVVAPFRHEQ